MRIVTFIALCTLSFALVACASEQGYRVKLDRLKGLSEAELIARLGAPTKSYVMENGSKALLYQWTKEGNEDMRDGIILPIRTPSKPSD